MEEAIEVWAADAGMTDDAFRAAYLSDRIPLGRFTTPEDVAEGNYLPLLGRSRPGYGLGHSTGRRIHPRGVLMPALTLTRQRVVARVTIDRPERKHAWSASMWTEMAALMDRCATDDSVRVVLVTSTGDRVFSAGADLEQFDGANPAAVRSTLEGVESVMASIEACPKPVIAVVSGAAVGAGTEVAAACDVRIASDRAWFSIPRRDTGDRHHPQRHRPAGARGWGIAGTRHVVDRPPPDRGGGRAHRFRAFGPRSRRPGAGSHGPLPGRSRHSTHRRWRP